MKKGKGRKEATSVIILDEYAFNEKCSFLKKREVEGAIFPYGCSHPDALADYKKTGACMLRCNEDCFYYKEIVEKGGK